ncbi:MAG TPA: undecaprenyldiphospho-muramoylpentapeptide beta-N-acetylglucosaminyltransferase [Mycobacteriales bacterium]|jgi:UDP-N-acetylglucosamine--N-acetylmuramyl-(pentapeptide) pyrophosphoryl-undecaprenol N-acetylglucosamine transferase|nr:undecaprenyldiphospho-muramoylpentapeptide beta-N-acetylglucosaminyltransferase [Mycobacteriales bacterium]
MRAVLAGGGSAGHVSPLLALADRLVADDPATEILALGTTTGLEARLVPARGYRLHPVPKVPLPRRPSTALLRLPVNLRAAVREARRAIDEIDAQVVVGFGGYVSAPAYLAARQAKVPIVVHEQNSRPGFANRLGARLTRSVAVTFPDTPLRHAIRTGMPLRAEIVGLDVATARSGARETFGLDPARTTLLVFGGSLGAQRLNDVVPQIAVDLRRRGIQVLHVTGAGKAVEVSAVEAGAPAYLAVDYVDQMELAYAAADFVIGRAGANTVSELTALGLPAAYVPLPIGNGEQRLNALPVVEAGGGLMVADADLDRSWLLDQVLPLMDDPEKLRTMGAAARGFGRLDADRLLADLVRAAIGGSR